MNALILKLLLERHGACCAKQFIAQQGRTGCTFDCWCRHGIQYAFKLLAHAEKPEVNDLSFDCFGLTVGMHSGRGSNDVSIPSFGKLYFLRRTMPLSRTTFKVV